MKLLLWACFLLKQPCLVFDLLVILKGLQLQVMVLVIVMLLYLLLLKS